LASTNIPFAFLGTYSTVRWRALLINAFIVIVYVTNQILFYAKIVGVTFGL